MNEGYRLSFQMATVGWDGKTINKIPADAISRTFDVMQGCGIDRVMLSGYHVEEPAGFDMDGETRRIGAELAARGMKASQHHGLSATFAPVDGPQDEAIEHLCRCIDFTANLGAETMVLHTGRMTGRYESVGQFIEAFERQCSIHGRDGVLACCAENLRIAGRYAGQRGVLIALENVDRFEPFGNIRDLPELVTRVASPAVGFCLDSGHAHCCGTDPLKWVEVMGDKLYTTHFHDNHGPRGKGGGTSGYITPSGIDEHLPPGFGTISWTDLIAALWRIGFSRTVTFECAPWPGMAQAEGWASAIRYWRTCEYLAAKLKH